jgi:hypothetical protein
MSPPDFQGLHEAFREDFWNEWDSKIAEALEWGFPKPPDEFERSAQAELILPQGVFRFAHFVKENCCKHRTERELAKFLKAAGYPKMFMELKIVTLAGCQKALADRQKARRETNAKQKRDKRIERKKTPKTKGLEARNA